MSGVAAVSPSVIIPCRNAAGTVGDAVRSCLAQSLPPHEVIVVDDGSSDGSEEVAAAAGARVVRNERRRNAGGARNRGIDEARGDVLAFMDADVVVAPDWLERAVAHLARDPRIVAVGGRIVNGRPGRWGDLDFFLSHSEWMSRSPGPRPTFPTMAVIYRRSAVGPSRFVETNWGEDTFFALEVLGKGGVLWYDPKIEIRHCPERGDWPRFWHRQVDIGRLVYFTRRHLDRPGRVLVRYPALLLLLPHLWIVLGRMVRGGRVGKVVTLFPWLVAGEVARIVGFLDARRRDRGEPGGIGGDADGH